MNIPLKSYYRLLAQYLRPQRTHVFWMALLLLLNIGLRLLNPQIMRFFIDTALNGGAMQTLVQAALLFLGVAVLGQALAVAATYFSERVAWTATNALRYDLTAHCLNLDLSFHKTRTPGELIERIDGDVDKLSSFFSRFTINIFGNALLMVGVLVMLFREDWRVGLALALFAGLGLTVLVRIRAFAIPFWERHREVVASFYGFLSEYLTATEDIAANGARGYVMQRFRTILREWLPIKLKADLAGYSMWMTNAGVFAIGTMLAFGLGGWLWLKGAVTLGAVYLIYNYTELLRDPIAQLRHQLTELQQAEASIKRINTLLTTSTRLTDGPQPSHVLPAGPLAVELTNVAFSYADEPDETVLDDLSFALQPGRVLGLLGRTGSGKSTLARLLLRLYDPTGGTLRVGGIEPSAVPLAAYRRRVGMVTQDVQLFQASVRDNLTFFDPTIPDAHIEEVLVDLGLGPWLHGLPSGLQSALAAGGAGLSAGQAQLLALARIFLTDPGLVIMDEASSRLDPATEMLLERAIDKLLHNRTAILIAHRLGTVQRADEILILEQGRIIEHDDRIVLAARPESRFAQLLRTGMAEVLA
ncbi:MAG: ABC transporter ATP-binding protein [Caldilineaceae bacterium]|nr:ABC transporter ATP-binding protein [Caldilineaceae bacterium]